MVLKTRFQILLIFLTPLPFEEEARKILLQKIKNLTMDLFQGCKIEIFGSYASELFLPSGDIDISIMYGGNVTNLLDKMKYKLKSFLELKHIEARYKAKVPLLRIIEQSTDITIDFTFNNTTGTENNNVIKNFCEKFPALRFLTLFIKQFIKHRQLGPSNDGLGGYPLVLMIVAFLQYLYREQGYIEENYAIILINFFRFYGVDFNYENVYISVEGDGEFRPKSDIHYDNNNQLYIENPLYPSINVAVACNARSIIKIKKAFKYAYYTLCLHNKEHGSYLINIFQNDFKVLVQNRIKLYENLSNGTVQKNLI